MDMQRRIVGYVIQNRKQDLTPKQARRALKKARRDARLRTVAEFTKTVLCSTCEVAEGPCVTKSGKATRPHKGRLATAA